MKNFCRILAICVASVVLVIAGILVVNALRQPKGKILYATDVEFLTLSGGMEMLIDNDLVLDQSMVKISPQNCEFAPEFTVKKFGAIKESSVTDGKVVFTETGRYTISCKVKSSESNYVVDKITIKVVDEPNDSTAMYVTKLDFDIKVGQSIALNEVAQIYPMGKVSKIVCSENVEYSNETVTAINLGDATIDIFVTSDNLTISKRICFTVAEGVGVGDVGLKLKIGETEIVDNIVEIEMSNFNFAISYEIVGIDTQNILCSTDGDILSVISYNAPEIILKPLNLGETMIHIVLVEDESIQFDIVIRII